MKDGLTARRSQGEIVCWMRTEGRVSSARPLESLPECRLDTSVANIVCFRHNCDLTGRWKVDSANAGLVCLLCSSLGAHFAGLTSPLVQGLPVPAPNPLLSSRMCDILWRDISALHNYLLKTLKIQSHIFKRCQGTNYFSEISFYPAFSKQTVPLKKQKLYGYWIRTFWQVQDGRIIELEYQRNNLNELIKGIGHQ